MCVLLLTAEAYEKSRTENYHIEVLRIKSKFYGYVFICGYTAGMLICVF